MEMTPEAKILKDYRTIAVVGLSSEPQRPAYSIASYMKKQGYRIIPVNPGESDVLGEKAYPDLSSVPEPIEIVNIFRRPEYVPDVVVEAITVGAKAIWMQEGIAHEEAAKSAEEAGLSVVMDTCIRTEHRRLAAGA
ncbi:MAG: CoA-binding protein [Chloroflexi bacterium]|nr:CoA-binding protein [Chloroflexota bacterium]